MRPAIVMGGAPCLESDLSRVPPWIMESAVRVSANDHGAKLMPVDWVVCGDKHHQQTKELMLDRVRKVTEAPVVTQHFVPGTIRLHDWFGWQAKASSGNMAMLWAWLLGCSPIILCGFELYQGGAYLSDPEAPSSGFGAPLREHLNRFRQIYHQIMPHAVRAMSGPISQVTGQCRQSEGFPPPVASERRRAWWLPVWTWHEVTADHDRARIGGARLPFGELVCLTGKERRFVEQYNLARRVLPEERVLPASPEYWNQVESFKCHS